MHLPKFDACPMHRALRASGIGRIKIQCPCIGFVLFHLKKVNAHLLTSKQIITLEPWFANFPVLKVSANMMHHPEHTKKCHVILLSCIGGISEVFNDLAFLCQNTHI